MGEALPRDLGTLFRLGEDERALQNGLNEIADAFRSPRRVRRVKPLRGFDVAGRDGDVGGQGVVTGRTMSGCVA